MNKRSQEGSNSSSTGPSEQEGHLLTDLSKLRDMRTYLVVYLTTQAARPKEKNYKQTKMEAIMAIQEQLPLHKTYYKVMRGQSTSNTELFCPFMQCLQPFRDLELLKSHIRSHMGARNYSCTFDGCIKSFQTKGHLNTHYLIHTGEKPFVCDICGSSYARMSRLNIHKRTHTGEKPYKCEVCLSSFTEKGNLNTHMRIHNGEKPYKCDVLGCSKAFTTFGHMKDHLKVHHNKDRDQSEEPEKIAQRMVANS